MTSRVLITDYAWPDLEVETAVLAEAGIEMVEELAGWCAAYPIVSLEDALAEDDWDGWRRGTARLAGRQLLGDDLFVTHPDRLQRGIAEGVANAMYAGRAALAGAA